MASRRRRRRPSSRGTIYDEAVIGKRLEDRRIELGLEIKAVCQEMRWDKSEWTRKTRGSTPISMVEHGRLHALLRGWYGFPFVDRSEGEALGALRDRLPEILRFLASPPGR